MCRQQRGEWIVRNAVLWAYPTDKCPAKCPAVASGYVPFGLEPYIDNVLGVIEQIPALPNQVRFRHI